MDKTNKALRLTALILVLALVPGCIQTEQSKKCDHITQTDLKDECLQYVGVWYQDPYTCYLIQDMQKREACIQDAVEPTKAKMLQVQKQEQTTPSIQKVVEEVKTQAKQANENKYAIDKKVQQCMEEQKLEMDVCLNKIAIETQNIEMCEQIETDTYRRPCISNIAINIKDPQICSKLTRTDDMQLCKFYASAG